MVRADAASYPDPAARLAEFAAQHPLNRLGEPAEVAHAVMFLVEAQFVTGSALMVDGGLLARMGTTVGYR